MSYTELLRRRIVNSFRLRHASAQRSPTVPTSSPSPLSHNTIQRALANPHALSAADLPRLQQTFGNHQINRMLQGKMQGEQTNPGNSGLRVGASNDHLEQSAQDVAAQVSQVATVQRSMSEEDQGGVVSGALRRRIEQARGGGSPAPEAVRRKMEAHTGADFSHVRVHHDQQADAISDELGAKAATYGRDIFLARNQSPHDVQLMAHEMTHTIQQGAVASPSGMMGGIVQPKRMNTIQREPDEKKIKKLKAKRFLAKLGSNFVKFTGILATLPLYTIDQLSVVDLHLKDFKNFVKTGKTRKDRIGNGKEGLTKDTKGTAKRVLGRTGLSGYARGLNSHYLTYDVGSRGAKMPWFSSLNPLTNLGLAGAQLNDNAQKYSRQIDRLQNPQQYNRQDDQDIQLPQDQQPENIPQNELPNNPQEQEQLQQVMQIIENVVQDENEN